MNGRIVRVATRAALIAAALAAMLMAGGAIHWK
jgi:hypothetical protein